MYIEKLFLAFFLQANIIVCVGELNGYYVGSGDGGRIGGVNALLISIKVQFNNLVTSFYTRQIVSKK